MIDKATAKPWTFKKEKVFKGMYSHKIQDLNGDEVNPFEYAELIVKAVNSHDALVEALKKIDQMTEDNLDNWRDDIREIAEQALKLAGGE